MTYTSEERNQIAEEYRARFGKYPPILHELDLDTVIEIAERAINRGSPINSADWKAAYREHNIDPRSSY